MFFQIFDLSYNRIRDIDRQSFARYDDIKLLYLQENMIQNLDENSFAHLTDLEVSICRLIEKKNYLNSIYFQAIDLSYNALTTIPVELFALPMLRNLYMQGNALLYLKLDLEVSKSTLQYLLKQSI
jgi:leucine-rich repeat transmembrane neuronal protein 1/2